MNELSQDQILKSYSRLLADALAHYRQEPAYLIDMMAEARSVIVSKRDFKLLSRAPRTECRKGHDLTKPDSQYATGRCRLCAKEAQRAYVLRKAS